MTRANIMQVADAMIDVVWTAPVTFSVEEREGRLITFLAGHQYIGIPYHWWGADTLAEFHRKLGLLAGGDSKIGNDCSSFVGHCWAVVDKRLTTATIEADATGPQRHCRSLGEPGTCQSAGLLPGDACNLANWHVILVGEVREDGVISAEQTPGPRKDTGEMRRFWSWKWLADNAYRPIRRVGLDDDAPSYRLIWPAVEGVTWWRLWVSRDGAKRTDKWLEGATEYTLTGLPDGVYRWWIQPWSVEKGRGAWLKGPDFSSPVSPGLTVEVVT